MQRQRYMSPIGEIILAAENGALVGLWFRGQKYECAGLCEKDRETDEAETLRSVSLWLDAYFAGEQPQWDIPLAPRGSDFRKRVWEELLRIPYGETRSYGEIGREIGCSSARAVGNAVGHNPISIIIPCHRVVGKDGKLTGFAGGVEKKEYLLNLESKPKSGTK